jgi:hypothetical protein
VAREIDIPTTYGKLIAADRASSAATSGLAAKHVA